MLVSSRTRDAEFSVRRGLCVRGSSSVSSVLNTSNPVTLTCAGVGGRLSRGCQPGGVRCLSCIPWAVMMLPMNLTF